MPLPAAFAPGTLFAIAKGVPMTKGAETWDVQRWDSGEARPYSPAYWMLARELDESAFRSAVRACEDAVWDTGAPSSTGDGAD